MQKGMHFLFVMLAAVFCTSAVEPHKFYVSKTTIELNPRSGMFEISSKIFTDDLEKAIGSTEVNPVRLGSDKEAADADQRIESYLKQHLSIKINNVPVELRYVGKEVESDLAFCYLEFYNAIDFTTIEVTNTILYEHFAEQQNIVDLVAHSKTSTAVLLQNQAVHIFHR